MESDRRLTRRYLIRGITIQPEGVAIEYLEVRKDMRPNGLTLNHIAFIPFSEDYDDGLEEMVDAAERVLSDALEDLDLLEPLDPVGELKQAAEEAQERADDEDDKEDQ